MLPLHQEVLEIFSATVINLGLVSLAVQTCGNEEPIQFSISASGTLHGLTESTRKPVISDRNGHVCMSQICKLHCSECSLHVTQLHSLEFYILIFLMSGEIKMRTGSMCKGYCTLNALSIVIQASRSSRWSRFFTMEETTLHCSLGSETKQ